MARSQALAGHCSATLPTLLVLALAMLLTSTAPGLVSAVTLPSADITNISPRYGSLEGGTLITISGRGFSREGKQGTTVVYVGNTICKQVEYYTTDTQIVCRTQPHPWPRFGAEW